MGSLLKLRAGIFGGTMRNMRSSFSLSGMRQSLKLKAEGGIEERSILHDLHV